MLKSHLKSMVKSNRVGKTRTLMVRYPRLEIIDAQIILSA